MHTHQEWVLNHRMLSNAAYLLIRENILQLQSLISTVTQFQLSFPGLKWERYGTSVLLWISAVTVTEGLLSLCLPPLGPVLSLFASSLCQSSISTAWCLQAEVYVLPAPLKSQGTSLAQCNFISDELQQLVFQPSGGKRRGMGPAIFVNDSFVRRNS